jgi:hypothetical protein
LETFKVTMEPAASELPAPGFCETTWFGGFVENTPRVVPDSPSFLSVWSATGAGLPTSVGTLARLGTAGFGTVVRAEGGATVCAVVVAGALFLSERVAK